MIKMYGVARRESILQVAVSWALCHLPPSCKQFPEQPYGQRSTPNALFDTHMIACQPRRRWAVVAETPYRITAGTFR